MDYDWKYFMDGLKADNAGMDMDPGDRLVARAVMYRMDKDRQRQATERIRDMLSDYRQQCGGREPVGWGTGESACGILQTAAGRRNGKKAA